MLAVFGAATLLHLLVVSVSRRRREVGLLKVVGFVNRQVASTVAWQATTLAVAGIVVGVPVGIVVGQAVWREFANNLGAVPVSVVPVWLIGLLIAGVLLGANLIAVAPALVATRSKPARPPANRVGRERTPTRRTRSSPTVVCVEMAPKPTLGSDLAVLTGSGLSPALSQLCDYMGDPWTLDLGHRNTFSRPGRSPR